MNKKNSVGYAVGNKSGFVGTSWEDGKLCPMSPDNSALKEELFGLAMGERREFLVFKRAFLNANRDSVSSRQ